MTTLELAQSWASSAWEEGDEGAHRPVQARRQPAASPVRAPAYTFGGATCGSPAPPLPTFSANFAGFIGVRLEWYRQISIYLSIYLSNLIWSNLIYSILFDSILSIYLSIYLHVIITFFLCIHRSCCNKRCLNLNGKEHCHIYIYIYIYRAYMLLSNLCERKYIGPSMINLFAQAICVGG